MSNSVIKLVDSSLIPASILIISKTAGIFLFSIIFKLNISYTAVLESLNLLTNQDKINLIHYSDIFMNLIMILGLAFWILKSVYLHKSHVNPRLLIKLVNYNIADWVEGSYKIYHSAVIWLAFNIVANLILWINTLQNKLNFTWPIIFTVLILISISILLQDMYKEIEDLKKHPGKYDWH